MKNIHTFRGCMMGGAAGDALGFPVKNLSYEAIENKYEKNGITGYDTDPQKNVALLSDATQMTLFTAGGLLTGKAMGAVLGYPTHLYRAYLDWVRAQYGEGLEADETVFGSTWLYRVPALNYMRSPENTCLNVLNDEERGSIAAPVNNSPCYGGVMRVAPIGLFFTPGEERSAEEIDHLGAEAAALTHGHEIGWLPAALLVRIIQTITYSEDYVVPSKADQNVAISPEQKKENLKKILLSSIEAIRNEFAAFESTDSFCERMEKSLLLAENPQMSDFEAFSLLGEGKQADEVLAIALFCVLKYADNFEKCLIAAVNHSGVSNATGAIAGNILGAFLGEDAIPEKFLNHLEIAPVIKDIADDLFTQYQEVGNDLWTAKYVMNNYKI